MSFKSTFQQVMISILNDHNLVVPKSFLNLTVWLLNFDIFHITIKLQLLWLLYNAPKIILFSKTHTKLSYYVSLP